MKDEHDLLSWCVQLQTPLSADNLYMATLLFAMYLCEHCVVSSVLEPSETSEQEGGAHRVNEDRLRCGWPYAKDVLQRILDALLVGNIHAGHTSGLYPERRPLPHALVRLQTERSASGLHGCEVRS